MNELKKLQFNIIRKVIIVDFFVIALFLLFSKDYMPLVMGVVFGTAIGLLNFMQLGNTLERAVKMPPTKASSFTTAKYFIRYLIVAIVLFVSVKSPQVNILGTVIGLVLIKFVILFTNLFNDKNFYRNIFKRREG